LARSFSGQLYDDGEADTDPFRSRFAPLPQVRRKSGT
jgi:hypothetical protein